MFKHFTSIILTLSVIFSSTLLFAQDNQKIEELERQLNRLEEKIQEAQHFASLFQNPILNQIVQSAEDYYRQARLAFQQRQYIRSAAFIKLAYAELTKIYRELKLNSQYRLKFRDRLNQKIQEAEQLTGQSGNTDADNFLNRAKFFRQRAFQLAETDRPEAAIKNYFLAIFFAENAIRAATGNDGRELHNLDRYFEDTRALMLQVREMDGFAENATAGNLFSQAEKELSNAYRFYKQNELRRAFQKVQLVNRMLYRIIDLLETEPLALEKRLESDLQLIENQVNEIQPEVQKANRPDLNRIYERLLIFLSSVKQRYDAKDYVAARNRLGLANRLLYRLQRLLSSGISEQEDTRILRQIETAESMMKSLESKNLKFEGSAELLSLAQKNLDAANIAYEEKNYNLALQNIRIFNNLALKIDQVQNLEERKGEKKEQINEELHRLEAMLNTPPDEVRTNELLKARYQNAKELFQIAQKVCAEQNYGLCAQLTRLAINLITQ